MGNPSLHIVSLLCLVLMPPNITRRAAFSHSPFSPPPLPSHPFLLGHLSPLFADTSGTLSRLPRCPRFALFHRIRTYSRGLQCPPTDTDRLLVPPGLCPEAASVRMMETRFPADLFSLPRRTLLFSISSGFTQFSSSRLSFLPSRTLGFPYELLRLSLGQVQESE